MSKPHGVAEAEKFIEEFYKNENTEEAPVTDTENTEEAEAGEKEEVKEEEQTEEKPSEEQDEDTWQHKYKVLDGKFKKEVPVLHTKVKELENELAQLRVERTTQQTTAEQAESDKKREGLEAALAKMSEEYGQEFIDHQRTLARAEAEALIEEKMKPFADRLSGVADTSQRAADAAYIQDLSKRAPHWTETKDDPEFHAWLAETDEFTGLRRYDIAKDAMEKGDSARVAAFYNAFKPQKKTEAPAPKKKDKEKLATPNPAPGPKQETGGAAEEEIIYSSDVAKFARDVIGGKYRGRSAEMQKIQAKYDAAQAAGRIRPD